jgi:hypothetical protein
VDLKLSAFTQIITDEIDFLPTNSTTADHSAELSLCHESGAVFADAQNIILSAEPVNTTSMISTNPPDAVTAPGPPQEPPVQASESIKTAPGSAASPQTASTFTNQGSENIPSLACSDDEGFASLGGMFLIDRPFPLLIGFTESGSNSSVTLETSFSGSNESSLLYTSDSGVDIDPDTFDIDEYLRTSREFSPKRLMVGQYPTIDEKRLRISGIGE